MDNKFRVDTNGERDIWPTAEETPETATFRGSGSQSQPQQMQSSQFDQPESSHHRDNGLLNGDLDWENLVSSLGSLSFDDLRFRHNRYNQVINGGDGARADADADSDANGGGGAGGARARYRGRVRYRARADVDASGGAGAGAGAGADADADSGGGVGGARAHYRARYHARADADASGGAGSGAGAGGGFGGGGCGSGSGSGYLFDPHAVYLRELELYRMQQRLSFQNNCFDRSYGYGSNGGFLNGVSYSSRNHVLDQNPWEYSNGYGAGMYNYRMGREGFGRYFHDQALSMEIARSGSSILSMARDQERRQHVQRGIVMGSNETFDMIFVNLIAHICDLMMDHSGNDVVKRLMGRCSSEQITQIVNMVTQDQTQFVNLCSDPLGSTAIQSLLRQMKLRGEEDQILRIMAAITTVALELTKSTNANNVILTCFREFTFSQCWNLLEVFISHFNEIAIEQQGSCMIQQCFEKCRFVNHEIKQRLIREIITHALRLCFDSYGNYVVQYIVELGDQHIIVALVQQLLGSFAHIARNKCGSHVVQKLLQLRSMDSRLIVLDLLREIDTLLIDPFGNYVIQTAWFVSKVDVRCMLKWHIERNIQLMRCNKFGNKILEKLNL